MTGKYILSYDEQQQAKSKRLAAARLQRLLLVRSQEMQLAKSRARAFQQLRLSSAQTLQQTLVELITQQRSAELIVLRAQYEQAMSGLAYAQRKAAANAQQLALEREQKQQLYLQRNMDAQQRFAIALQRVQSARQTELQAVLNKVQRQQAVLRSQRELAKGFAEQQKQRATQDAQQHAEVNLQQEQRRRHNQTSKIDFKYSRLHEMGVPQLVVNHKESEQQDDAGAATKAQLESARTGEQLEIQQQQEQENARKAKDRGVRAHMLLQAERNRHCMEQALQAMEGKAILQRQQDLAAGQTSAAPLLRKWQQQKRKVQARKAFEQDFLHGPAAAATRSLLAFLETDQPMQPAAAPVDEESAPQPSAAMQAAAADRACKLVAELERQRRAELASAAEESPERQQRQQWCRQPAPIEAAELAVQQSTTVALSEVEIPVEVEDLMSYIPPASYRPVSSATAFTTGTGTVTAAVQPGAKFIQQKSQPPVSPACKDSRAITASAPLLSGTALRQDPLSYSRTSGAEAAAEPEQPVQSSQDCLADVMHAADEVLMQLPSDMQAAAAARAAAAAGRKLPDPTLDAATQGRQESVQSSAGQIRNARPADMESIAACAGARLAVQSVASSLTSDAETEGSRFLSSALDSSTDAAAILQELHELQVQLGVQALGSSSLSDDLSQLAVFDAQVDQPQPVTQGLAAAAETAPRISQPAVTWQNLRGSVQSGTAAARAAAKAAARAQALPQQQQPGVLATPVPGVSEKLRAAALALDVSSSFEGEQAATDLEALIDGILAPDYSAALLAPQPSVSSPTHPTGRSGRRAAAAEAASQQQQHHPPLSDPWTSADLESGLKAVQQGLLDLGLSSVTLSSDNTSSMDTEHNATASQGSIGDRGQLGTSSSETLPITVLQAAASSHATGQPLAWQQQTKPQESSSAAVPTTVLSSGLATAAAGGRGYLPWQQQHQQGLLPAVPSVLSTSGTSIPTTIAATTAADAPAAPQQAAAAAAVRAEAPMSGLTWSLSTTTDDASLHSLAGLAATAQQHSRAVGLATAAGGGHSWKSSAATSLPSTSQGCAAVANGGRQTAAAGTQGAMAAAVHDHPPASTDAESLPTTLNSVLDAQAAGVHNIGRNSVARPPAVHDQYQLLQELLSLRDSSMASSDADGMGALLRSIGSTGSSSISSFIDEGLDHLLQQALAGMSAAAMAPASTAAAATAVGYVGNQASGCQLSRQQQQQEEPAGLSDKMLESLHGPDGMMPAAAAGGSRAGGTSSITVSISTALPSTIIRQIPANAQFQIPCAVDAATASAAAAVAENGSPAGPSGTTSIGTSSSSSSSRGSARNKGICGASPADMIAASQALKMAKQSSRERAAAAAAAAPSSVSGISVPTTVERQLLSQQQKRDARKQHQQQQQQDCLNSLSVTSQATPQVSSSVRSRLHFGAAPASTVDTTVSQSLPSTILRSAQQQTDGGDATAAPAQLASWHMSTYSSSYASSPRSAEPPQQRQQQHPVSVAVTGGAGGSGNTTSSSSSSSSSSMSLPGTLLANMIGGSGSSEKDTATAAAAGACGLHHAVNTTATQVPHMLQQQQAGSTVQGLLERAKDVLETIDEEVGPLTSGTTAATPGTASNACLHHSRQPPPWSKQQPSTEYATSAAAAVRTGSSSSSSSSLNSVACAGSSDAGVGISHEDLLSSGSFSDVVSGLMQHIDTTLASLAGATNGSGLPGQPLMAAAAAAAPCRGSADTASGIQQRGAQQSIQAGGAAGAGQQPWERQQQLQWAPDALQSSSGSSSSNSAARDGPGSVTFCGVSGSASTATCSSTEQLIQHTLGGLVPLSPSDGSDDDGDDTQSSRLQVPAATGTVEPGGSGAAMAVTSAAATAAAPRGSADPDPWSAAHLATRSVAASCEQATRLIEPEASQQQSLQQFMADVLASVSSTAASGDTEQLLGSLLAAVSPHGSGGCTDDEQQQHCGP